MNSSIETVRGAMNTDTNALSSTADSLGDSGWAARRAPRPHTIESTGVGELYLADLVVKHLYHSGVLDLADLCERVALSGRLSEEILAFLRDEGRVEVRGRCAESGVLRYALTERGRVSALEALERDGYVGPAPVTVEEYERLVALQSVGAITVDCERIREVFGDTVIRPGLLDQLGPAMHSGRAMFFYGEPGTGKSFIARRLSRVFADHVLIPHAVLAGDKAVRVFDPGFHRPVAGRCDEDGLLLDRGHDPRYALCERPVLVTGGELTLDRLDIQYDTATGTHQAPIQLKATNGLLVIDDLGRQRMAPLELFNRWIIPLEERRDFLTLRDGRHFQVPFDLVLVFSTNKNPLELADEAFLRRIGYKIRFDPLEASEYTAIWWQECERRGLEYDPALVRFVIHELHGIRGVPLLPCHPRDLIDLALDYGRYAHEPALTPEALNRAWDSYFVRLD